MPYRDVVNALEHLILSRPTRPDLPVDDMPLLMAEHWESLMQSTDAETKLYVGRKAVHVLTGLEDPDKIATGLGVQAFTVFRYSGVRATPYQSSNVHDVTWTVMLDILVKGTVTESWTEQQSSRLVAELDVGVYSPRRGELVDYLVNRCMRNPILTPVVRRPNPNYVELGMAGETPFERGSVDTYIRAVQVEDTTDLNYWTLLWTAGLPNSFLGWWPSTLTFTVNERVSPQVESYG